jgi:hypothetical protein
MRKYIEGVDAPSLYENPDLFPHSLEVHQLHGLEPHFRRLLGKAFQKTPGSQPGSLPSEGNGRQTCALSGLDQPGEIDVSGEILLANGKEGVSVDPLPPMARYCSVTADSGIEEPGALEPVITGDEHPPIQPLRQLGVESCPGRRHVANLPLLERAWNQRRQGRTG